MAIAGTIEWLNANSGAISGMATAVIALMAIVTVYLTRNLAKENQLLRKAGTEPEVVVYLAPDSTKRQFVNLVLANVGQGPAKNIAFEIEANLTDFQNHNVSTVFASNRVTVESKLLPQGERIQSLFGHAPALKEPVPLAPFKVLLSFEDFKGKKHANEFELDSSDLGWISWVESG